jgi:outer membrane protein assembly factor BamE (lipoprotein component of BamABCDE complex)
MDGLKGIFFSSGIEDDTVWAPGYSDDAFLAVRSGMTREEVYALLGQPLEVRSFPMWSDFDTRRQNPGEVVECWTVTPNNSSYRVRQIVFSGDKVVDKFNEFYLD